MLTHSHMVVANLASMVMSWATECEMKLITVHFWWFFSYASVVFVPKLKWSSIIFM